VPGNLLKSRAQADGLRRNSVRPEKPRTAWGWCFVWSCRPSCKESSTRGTSSLCQDVRQSSSPLVGGSAKDFRPRKGLPENLTLAQVDARTRGSSHCQEATLYPSPEPPLLVRGGAGRGVVESCGGLLGLLGTVTYYSVGMKGAGFGGRRGQFPMFLLAHREFRGQHTKFQAGGYRG
jgi:hypothetical protein